MCLDSLEDREALLYGRPDPDKLNKTSTLDRKQALSAAQRNKRLIEDLRKTKAKMVRNTRFHENKAAKLQNISVSCKFSFVIIVICGPYCCNPNFTTHTTCRYGREAHLYLFFYLSDQVSNGLPQGVSLLLAYPHNITLIQTNGSVY